MKRFCIDIDELTHLRLTLYAAHLGATKAFAGTMAIEEGIPDWVMSIPPSQAIENAQKEQDQTNCDESLSAILVEKENQK